MCNCDCSRVGDSEFQKIVIGQLELLGHRLRILTVTQEEMKYHMATSREQIAELVGATNEIKTTVDRVYAEVTARTADLEAQIDTLEEKIAAETVSVEDLQPLRDALETVNLGAKQLDDLNTDQVEVPEEPPVEPETPVEPTPEEPVEGEAPSQ